MNSEKINAFMAVPESLAELLQCKNVAEAAACLNKAGAECTEEDTLEILKGLRDAIQNDSMSADDLETVAGGGTMVGDMIRTVVGTGLNTYQMIQANKYLMPTMLTQTGLNLLNGIVNGITGETDPQPQQPTA